MNRGLMIAMAALFGAGQAQAHVSGAQGMAHAFEHLWLLLGLVVVIGLVPVAGRLIRNRKD
jgi:hypothetical protein